MKQYIYVFIAMFLYIIPLDFTVKDNFRTSKHFGACLSPRMSKRKR